MMMMVVFLYQLKHIYSLLFFLFLFLFFWGGAFFSLRGFTSVSSSSSSMIPYKTHTHTQTIHLKHKHTQRHNRRSERHFLITELKKKRTESEEGEKKKKKIIKKRKGGVTRLKIGRKNKEGSSLRSDKHKERQN